MSWSTKYLGTLTFFPILNSQRPLLRRHSLSYPFSFQVACVNFLPEFPYWGVMINGLTAHPSSIFSALRDQVPHTLHGKGQRKGKPYEAPRKRAEQPHADRSHVLCSTEWSSSLRQPWHWDPGSHPVFRSLCLNPLQRIAL